MNRGTPRLRDIAKRLITFEQRKGKATATSAPPVLLVCEKLRRPLATLMGQNGFRALLARALVLAGAEEASLRTLEVKPDGTLTARGGKSAAPVPAKFSEGQIVLIARLLGLLVAFVGENLTYRIVREIWPQLNPKHLKTGTPKR